MYKWLIEKLSGVTSKTDDLILTLEKTNLMVKYFLSFADFIKNQ